MNRRMFWPKVAVGTGNAFTLFIAMVAVSVHLGGPARVPAFALQTQLDYSQPPDGELAPLASSYVAGILGSSGDPHTIEPGRAAGRGRVLSTRRPPNVVDHPATNDDVAEAYPVSSVPFAARTDTTGASRESAEPQDCSPAGGTLWYRFTAPDAGSLVASTAGTDYPVTLGVFSGTPRTGLSRVACSTDARGSAGTTFSVPAGQTTYFQITTPLSGGHLVFTLTRVARTMLVSSGSDGRTGSGASDRPVVSADGRYVAFYSNSPTFDQRCPCAAQVYVRDLVTGVVKMASRSTTGGPGNDVSVEPDISADGRYVSFHSIASDLVPGDTNGDSDVFVRDMVLGRTERVSVTSSNEQANGYWSHISADGRYVVFAADAANLRGTPNSRRDIYRRDRSTGRTVMISVASDGTHQNADATFADLSPDGRYVIFWSRASNLVPGVTGVYDDVINALDTYHGHMFVHDTVTRRTTAECVAADGTPANDECPPGAALSWDGRYSVFRSVATNLVPGASTPSGVNQISHIFVRDRRSGVVELASVSSSGDPAGDPHQRAIPVVRGGTLGVRWVSISWDGRFVAFDSGAPDLVPSDTNGKTDVFIRDRELGRTTRASVGPSGTEADDNSSFPMLSGDGRLVVFACDAKNMSAADGNQLRDVYART